MRKTLQKGFEYFLIGTLGILPILLVIQIVIAIEGLLKDFVVNVSGRYESLWLPSSLFILSIVVLIYFGFLLKHDKAHLLYFFEKLINRIPLLGTIYRVSKKILALFKGDDANRLQDVVYIEYPKDGLWVPAYVTNKIDDKLVLYVPTSPNPTSGFTIIVHKSKAIASSLSIEEASSFVISLGVDFPKPEEANLLSLEKRAPGG